MDNREEEITRHIELLRKKNERLEQRHKEVQADKKFAEKSGQSLIPGSSCYDSPRESHSGGNKQKNQGSPYSRAHMDNEEDQNEQQTYHRSRRNQQRGRGQLNVNAPMPRRGRGGHHNQSYEAKRLENFRLMEEEMAHVDDSKPKGEGDSSPGTSRLLDDPRRKGELDPDNRWKSTRHKGNYGGLHFENVKTGMRWGGRTHKGGGRGRGLSRMQVTAEYTGRERQDQERWQVMREAADREIMARSRNAEGAWRREWDAEKDSIDVMSQDTKHPKQYYERRSRGRGRHGFAKGHGNARGHFAKHSEEPADPTDKEMEQMAQQDETNVTSPAKPQRARNKQVKSPGHLLQQRAQTPSSKDGTEVWAQNSHHSDEAGGDWKNGANQSGDQWLPSLEGNSNPAIDERLLEQQEDGATVYSQQLGRGWGSEKNIKATKAWVIDTEKAGTTQCDESNSGVMNTDVAKTDDKFSKSHSASPRLKKKAMGLTVEIDKAGRHVKAQGCHSNEHFTEKMPSNIVEDAQKNVVADVQSPDFLKTPEGMKHVTDWATEMDMQSPTYETRQLELLKSTENLSSQTNNEPDSTPCERHEEISTATITDQTRQEATEAVSGVGIAQMQTAAENPEVDDSHLYSIDGGGTSKSSISGKVVQEDMVAVTSCEKSPQTNGELDICDTDSLTLMDGNALKTSLESIEIPQGVSSGNELVQEKQLTQTNVKSSVDQTQLLTRDTEPSSNLPGSQEITNNSEVSLKSEPLPLTVAENNDPCHSDDGSDKSTEQTENTEDPTESKVTGFEEEALPDEEDVDDNAKCENVRHGIADTTQNEQEISLEIDNNAAEEDEFFECDEDRKKDDAMEESSRQLCSSDAMVDNQN